MFGLEKKASLDHSLFLYPGFFFFPLLDKEQLNLKQAELRK